MLRLGLVERQLIVAIHDWHYYDLNEQALRKKMLPARRERLDNIQRGALRHAEA